MDAPQRFTVGLIGSSIGSSLSPPLHEREADELGLRYVYQLIDIDALGLAADAVGDLVAQAERMGFAGLNITHPCKQKVLGVLDELSPEADALQTVNTVVFRGGRRIGHNTDHLGFAEGFERGLPAARLHDVVLIGAGGAGAAVAHALLGLGVQRLTVVDVLTDRAAHLVTMLRPGDTSTVRRGGPGDLGRLLTTADGVVNASTVGMTPHLGTPVPPGLLRPEMWVADVVYRPLETELLRDARDLGCRTLTGGGMVVFQAAASLALFTGITPDADRMYRHFQTLTAVATAPGGGELCASPSRPSH
jgi:shikimate dehydrogenase